MNVATRILAENGITVVVAAGNFGPANNTLNRWAVAPWAIGVGAAYADGQLYGNTLPEEYWAILFTIPRW